MHIGHGILYLLFLSAVMAGMGAFFGWLGPVKGAIIGGAMGFVLPLLWWGMGVLASWDHTAD